MDVTKVIKVIHIFLKFEREYYHVACKTQQSEELENIISSNSVSSSSVK